MEVARSGAVYRRRPPVPAALVLLSHANRSREGAGIPRTSHPFARTALAAGHGGDQEPAATGPLHDAAEDRSAEQDMARGGRFALRAACTLCARGDPQTLPKPRWRDRKGRCLEGAEADAPLAPTRAGPRDASDVVAASPLRRPPGPSPDERWGRWRRTRSRLRPGRDGPIGWAGEPERADARGALAAEAGLPPSQPPRFRRGRG